MINHNDTNIIEELQAKIKELEAKIEEFEAEGEEASQVFEMLLEIALERKAKIKKLEKELAACNDNKTKLQ